MAKKRRRRRAVDQIDETPHGGRPEPGRLAAGWRMFPMRGRFLPPEMRYVFERLPAASGTFTAADVAVLCVEADRELGLDLPCNPAEVIDLLTSRALVAWTADGFVKRARPRPRPRA